MLSSTTVMSFPAEDGAPGVSRIVAAPAPGARTTKFDEFDSVPSGFCSRTERFPANCRSPCVSDVVHCAIDEHEVGRAEPAIRIVDPGPGFDARKPLPEISSVKPPAEPAYALDGATEEIFGLLEIATVAVPDWPVSSELVAVTLIRFGEGGESGARNRPVESMDPHAPETPQPAPVMFHVTC